MTMMERAREIEGERSPVQSSTSHTKINRKRVIKVTDKIGWKSKTENGAVQIVEAAFIFPIMFIILFFLIYMGNALYVRAQIESVVETYALEGAGYCADPILETIKQTGKLPPLSALKTKPYRYLFGGMGEIETKIGNSVEAEIKGQTSSFFTNMMPSLKTPAGKIAHFNNYVVYSTFSVEVECNVGFPIRFLGSASPMSMVIKARAESPVDDTAEFIRNTDMVVDLMYKTKIGQTISDIFGKVNDFISSFASK